MSAEINKNVSSPIREKCEAILTSLKAIGCGGSIGDQSHRNLDSSPSSSTSSFKTKKSAKKSATPKGQPVTNVYKWPADDTESVIPPTRILRRSNGNLVPLYKRQECSPYFIVAVDGPIKGVPIVDDDAAFMKEMGRLKCNFKFGWPKPTSSSSSTSASTTTDSEAQPKSTTDSSSSASPSSTEAESTIQEPAPIPSTDPQPMEIDISEEALAERKLDNIVHTRGCSFCRSNGEGHKVFNSHILMTEDRKVVCPYLSKYVCPICNATGEDAHTLKYCPERPTQQKREDRRNFPRLVRSSIGRYTVSRY